MSLCHNRDLKIRLGTDRRRFGGDVSSMEWMSGAGTGTRSYDFAYDGLGRLVSADYGEYGDHVWATAQVTATTIWEIYYLCPARAT